MESALRDLRFDAPVTSTLLADADDRLRRGHAAFLRDAGWTVDEANDGRIALARIFSVRPHIVVADVDLPGMSGIDLCRVVRRDASISATAVVLLTTDGAGPLADRAHDAGADLVAVKPSAPQALDGYLRHLSNLTRDAMNRTSRAHDQPVEDIWRSRERVEHSQQALRRARRQQAELTRVALAEPPVADLRCLHCGRMLRYMRSFEGGASARLAERWDYYLCEGGCGEFQYRPRTRRLRPAP